MLSHPICNMERVNLERVVRRQPVDRALDAFMASHHGVITHDRAVALGATRSHVQTLLTAGAWEMLNRGVYRAAAAPRTAEQELLAAVWRAGQHGMASHRSAAWLWRLWSAPPRVPEISVPYSQSPQPKGTRVHRSTDLIGAPISARRGIAVTDPLRTVIDTVGVLSHDGGTLIVDRAIELKLVTVDGLLATLERYGRRGRRGAGKLRTILEERGVSAPGRAPTVLESRMARIARMMDAPPPIAEYPVAGGLYYLDFAWPEIRVAAEVDGWQFHSSYPNWKRGIRRDRWCDAHDWLAPHFDYDEVTRDPYGVADELGRILRRRMLEFGEL